MVHDFMIDIHSHILHGVDDGASGFDESLALARIYVKEGFRQVVATPHAEVDSLPVKDYGRSIRESVDQLNDLLVAHHVALTVLPGMEVSLDPRLPELVSKGQLLTLADSSYLLVEMPFQKLPLNWWEIVRSLAGYGIAVIWAHPERCAQVGVERDLLERMADIGTKFQVNWDSFIGAYGSRVSRVAWAMVRKGMAHCLATDSHDSKTRNAGCVSKIAADLEAIIGVENFTRLCLNNPCRVIEGKALL